MWPGEMNVPLSTPGTHRLPVHITRTSRALATQGKSLAPRRAWISYASSEARDRKKKKKRKQEKQQIDTLRNYTARSRKAAVVLDNESLSPNGPNENVIAEALAGATATQEGK